MEKTFERIFCIHACKERIDSFSGVEEKHLQYSIEREDENFIFLNSPKFLGDWSLRWNKKWLCLEKHGCYEGSSEWAAIIRPDQIIMTGLLECQKEV